MEKNPEDEYDVKRRYNHSVYNTEKDISKSSVIYKLMEKGLFTNSWFSILTNQNHILENDDCEHMKNRMRKSHTGFNLSEYVQKKNKIK